MLALLKLSGGDFRAPVFFNTLAWAGLAVLMVCVVRRVRGRTSYADAFFPLILLNLQYQPMAVYRGEQIFYIWPTAIACAMLAVIVLAGARLTLGTAILMGTCLGLLPLASAPGLTYLPAFTAWALCTCLVSWRSGARGAKRNSLCLGTFTLLALGLLFLYFVGYDWHASFSPPSPDMGVTLRSALQFLTGSFGVKAASSTWPYSGMAMLALLLLSVSAILWELFASGKPRRRWHALGLLFFLGATSTLALAIGWGRGGVAESIQAASMLMEYTSLSVVVLCGCYFAWAIHQHSKVATALTSQK